MTIKRANADVLSHDFHIPRAAGDSRKSRGIAWQSHEKCLTFEAAEAEIYPFLLLGTEISSVEGSLTLSSFLLIRKAALVACTV